MTSATNSPQVEDFAHGRVPREVRVRQILALADELFTDRGYQGASMDELARRAGISKPVIYELVGNKEQVFAQCIERAADELAETVTAAVAGEADWTGQLRSGGLAFFRFVEARRQTWAVLLSGGATPFSTGIDRIRRRQADLVATLLASATLDARGTTTLTPGEALQVSALAHALNGAFESLAGWWQEHPDVPAETLADWVADLSLPGLAALAARPT